MSQDFGTFISFIKSCNCMPEYIQIDIQNGEMCADQHPQHDANMASLHSCWHKYLDLILYNEASHWCLSQRYFSFRAVDAVSTHFPIPKPNSHLVNCIKPCHHGVLSSICCTPNQFCSHRPVMLILFKLLQPWPVLDHP